MSAAPQTEHDPLVQLRPSRHPAVQQGSPAPPQARHASEKHSAPGLHAGAFSQHDWPGAPQARHTCARQVRDGSHAAGVPTQQRRPAAPQGSVASQMPPTQAPTRQLGEPPSRVQQGSPWSPQRGSGSQPLEHEKAGLDELDERSSAQHPRQLPAPSATTRIAARDP
jgi:hypothetical protein